MSLEDLVQLSDNNGGFRGLLDQETGHVYDKSYKKIYSLQPSKEDTIALADYAATYDAHCIVRQTRKPVTMRDKSFVTEKNPRGERKITLSDAYDAPYLMDLAPSDVHIARGLPGYAAGYTLADGVADIVAPPFMTPNQQDLFWTWNQNNQFQPQTGHVVGAGGSVGEVNPVLSNTPFITVPYALGGFITSEVQSNADAPLQVQQTIVRQVMDKLRLARELRVASLTQTSGNWGTSQLLTEPAANKWDGGASSDPIADLHLLIEQSYLPVKRIVWSELVEHWFIRHPQVQKYFAGKNDYEPLPSGARISQMLNLPEITTAKIKYLPSQTGGITYVWGNHVVLLHDQAALATGQDVQTARTFRWGVAPTSDGQAVGGFLVRTYFDPKRGPRGGTAVVVSHWDAEVMTSKFVGGLILNAYQ